MIWEYRLKTGQVIYRYFDDNPEEIRFLGGIGQRIIEESPRRMFLIKNVEIKNSKAVLEEIDFPARLKRKLINSSNVLIAYEKSSKRK